MRVQNISRKETVIVSLFSHIMYYIKYSNVFVYTDACIQNGLKMLEHITKYMQISFHTRENSSCQTSAKMRDSACGQDMLHRPHINHSKCFE